MKPCQVSVVKFCVDQFFFSPCFIFFYLFALGAAAQFPWRIVLTKDVTLAFEWGFGDHGIHAVDWCGPMMSLRIVATNWIIWPAVRLISQRFLDPDVHIAMYLLVAFMFLTWVSYVANPGNESFQQSYGLVHPQSPTHEVTSHASSNLPQDGSLQKSSVGSMDEEVFVHKTVTNRLGHVVSPEHTREQLVSDNSQAHV